MCIRDRPPGIGFEWTGQSYEEQQAGSQASLLFGLSILIVFLVDVYKRQGPF